MSDWVAVLAWIGGAWVVLCALAWALQRRFQYFPARGPVPRPPSALAPSLETVRLETADGVALEAWLWPGRRDTTLVLLHGNAGHRGHRLEWMRGLRERGWSVFLLDWRGYGGSAGRPSEAGFLRDAEAAVAWLEAAGRSERVYVGESIGCAVAVRLAARHPPAGLVLQAGAISLLPVAQRAYPILPMRLLLRDRFDVSGDAPRVACPALCIHGDLDEIVPVELGRALCDALGGAASWYEIAGAGHNDVVVAAGEAWYDRVHAFLTSLHAPPPSPAG